MRFRNRITLALGILLLIFFTVSMAQAATMMDFVLLPSSGTITFNGTFVKGDDISVGYVYINGIKNDITNGQLDFTSGNANGTWSFGSGGKIDISGTIGGYTGLLISGSFDSSKLSTVASFPPWFNFDILGGSLSFTQSFSSTYPSGLYLGGLNLSFMTSSNVNAGDTFGPIPTGSGDLVGTTVPIPAAAWLLGSGLMGLIGIGRRSFFGKA